MPYMNAKQLAEYVDLVFRWLATKTNVSRANAELCQALSAPEWRCASTIDFDYYSKTLDEPVTVCKGECPILVNCIVVHQGEGGPAHFEFKGPDSSIRFPVCSRVDLTEQFSALLFPELSPSAIAVMARTPLQTCERLRERQSLVEAAVDEAIHGERDYVVCGAGVVIHNRRVEKKLVFRSRGNWPLRLSVELLNDDTYEINHDANTLKWNCTEGNLASTISQVLSNGFAEVIRRKRRDSFDVASYWQTRVYKTTPAA